MCVRRTRIHLMTYKMIVFGPKSNSRDGRQEEHVKYFLGGRLSPFPINRDAFFYLDDFNCLETWNISTNHHHTHTARPVNCFTFYRVVCVWVSWHSPSTGWPNRTRTNETNALSSVWYVRTAFTLIDLNATRRQMTGIFYLRTQMKHLLLFWLRIKPCECRTYSRQQRHIRHENWCIQHVYT